MPIYEYRCERCGDFEEMQRITDPPLARCPRCRHRVRRLISSTSFQLKGSGWYVTDYARAGRGTGDGTKDGAKKEGGTETPAAPEGAKATGDAKPKPEPSGAGEKPAS